MTENLVVGEALRVFGQKAQETGTEINANYELVNNDLVSHFFPPKALQCQNRYLKRGVYKPHNTKILYLICRIYEMVNYIKNFSPFRSGQRLPEYDILELVEFSLPKKWQKELIIQGFDSVTQGLTELVKFCERLETAEEILKTQGEGNQQNRKTNQSSERHQSVKLAQRKRSN